MSVKDWVSLIRPANSTLVGFAVIVGIAVVSNQLSEIISTKSLLGFVTGFGVSAFSMITNDIYDLKVDAINQPNRPLPSGRISLAGAKVFSLPFLVIGLAAAATLGLTTLAIAVIFAFVGWYYNYQGKKIGLLGNSLVALSLAIPYIFGSVALGNYSVNLAYLLALTSFLAGLGREVLKGISDVEGDKIRKIRTVAIVKGVKFAKFLASTLFLLAVFSSSLPVIFGLLGGGLYIYLGLISIPDFIFLYLTAKTVMMKQNSQSLKLKGIALLGMLFGLLAYLIAGLSV